MAVVGIIPAAGSGERLGADGPKAFVLLGGRPMLDWSLAVLDEVCDRVVVAVPAGHEAPGRVIGGASRSESVRIALEAAPEAEVVVVHDAARPFVSADLVRECLDALGDADGAIAATRVTDTVKQVNGDGEVVRTPDRSLLWAVQTPQVFRAETLRRALEGDVSGATDDASLVEAAGGVVRVVQAPAENFKITGPHDLRLAEALT